MLKDFFTALGKLFLGVFNFTLFSFPVKVWMLLAAAGAFVFWSSLVAILARVL